MEANNTFNRAKVVGYSLAKHYVAIWLVAGMCFAFIAIVTGFSVAIEVMNELNDWRGLFYFYGYWLFVMTAPFVLYFLGRALYRLMFPQKND